MSVQVNTYVMYGVVLNYEEVKAHVGKGFYELFEPYIDNAFKPETNPKDGITVLFDGMNGKYIAIGQVVEKTANHRSFDDVVSVAKYPTLFTAMTQTIQLYKSASGKSSLPKMGWHVISHKR